MSYKVNEIFYSIQGEGCNTGEPAVFVRFSMCNLACSWCDTDFVRFSEMNCDEIVSDVMRLWPSKEKTPIVVLTGGEPALQVDETLVEALHKKSCFIAIETNGTRKLPEGIDWVTCSPKENTHLQIACADEVKVVFTGTFDLEIWRQKIETKHWLLQPLSKDGTSNTADVIDYVRRHPEWRLSVQLHKLVGIR